MTHDTSDVEFDAEGVTLRGTFFSAAEVGEPKPCVVMAHGWAGEVTHFIDDFANVFAAAGISALAYDHRGWGNSDVGAGKPRHESEPWEQIRDYQHAISYVQNRPDVDPDRIGVWGSSFSQATLSWWPPSTGALRRWSVRRRSSVGSESFRA